MKSSSFLILLLLLVALPVSAHEESSTAATNRQPVVLVAFPTKPDQFRDDLRPFVERIIARHGFEEWNTVVLVHELHRHLGVFSVLGAKMGLRARELLGASLDDLRVESHAGFKPPVSCFNDGLQVATGASLGRGTITVSDEDKPVPEAVFVFGDKRLRLRVKADVLEKVRKSMQAVSGDMNSPAVRRVSIEAWAELDRAKIFDEFFEQPLGPTK